MVARTSLHVSLTPELDRFLQERLSSGRYQTASEIIHEGLRLLEEKERTRDKGLESLREKLALGAAQAERGEVSDPNEVLKDIATIKRKLAKKKR